MQEKGLSDKIVKVEMGIQSTRGVKCREICLTKDCEQHKKNGSSLEHYSDNKSTETRSVQRLTTTTSLVGGLNTRHCPIYHF